MRRFFEVRDFLRGDDCLLFEWFIGYSLLRDRSAARL